MKGLAFNTLMIMAMAIACMMVTERAGAMSYGDISQSLSDCMWYLTGHQEKPSQTCCEGVRHLEKLATNTSDKRVACECVRETIERMHGINRERLDSLARECSAKLPYFKYLKDCDGGNFRRVARKEMVRM